MRIRMDANQLVLVQGARRTRATLVRWQTTPWPVLAPWFLLAAAIAAGLLCAVVIIGSLATPDATPILLPGLTAPSSLGAVGHVLYRNALVLALHGFACVAGFIAGSELPAEVDRHRGAWRRVHALAGPLAIAFVAGATLFSLGTQAFVLGSDAATLAAQLHIGQATLILTLLPHAVPELTALFLPLAAWLVASRRGRFDELLAATAVTVAIALPVLGVAALIEVYVWPYLLWAASPLG